MKEFIKKKFLVNSTVRMLYCHMFSHLQGVQDFLKGKEEKQEKKRKKKKESKEKKRK